MGIPKKGSRRITIDDVVYRWHVRHKPSYGQANGESPFTVAVELYDQPVSKLIIQFSHERPDAWLSQLLFPQSATPKQIAAAIRIGLEQGWQPTQADHHVKVTSLLI